MAAGRIDGAGVTRAVVERSAEPTVLWVEGGLAGERRLFAELASVRPTEDRVERCADLDGALARLARGGVDAVVLSWL